jgi:thiol:disulfide interchange protein DsbD
VSKENKLRLLSGFPPPEFYSLKSQESDCPLGLDCYKDFETGWEVAQKQQKPILLDFTGWACVNCRKMEENVWSDDEVYRYLKDDFIIISLYVDDRTELSEEEQFTYLYANGKTKTINTIGKKWATFQAENFQTASQPFYVQIQTDGTLLNSPIQYSSITEFKAWLRKGLDNQQVVPKANYLNF